MDSIQNQKNDDYFFIDLSNKEYIDKKNDIILLNNNKAVLESVKNIILTEPGEKPYDPEFGVTLNSFLFVPLIIDYGVLIVEEIERKLLRYEPRINALEIVVAIDDEESTFVVIVIFTIKGSNNEQQQLQYMLKKIR